jgi:hypothetical protein
MSQPLHVEATEVSDKPPSRQALVGDDEPPSTTAVATVATAAPKPSIQTHIRWNDWRWQMSHRIRSVEQLFGYFPDKAYCQSIEPVIGKYPMAITPYYASLIRKVDLADPVFQMCVPQLDELYDPRFCPAIRWKNTMTCPSPDWCIGIRTVRC